MAAEDEAPRTTPEKKLSIRKRLAEARREYNEFRSPDKVRQNLGGTTYEPAQVVLFQGENRCRKYNKICKNCISPTSRCSGR